MSAAMTQKPLKYREMSQEQRIAYHSKQTETIRFKARCKVLNHVITEHPETLNICMEHLRTLGYDIPSEAPKRAKSMEFKVEKGEEQDDVQEPTKEEGEGEEPASGSKTRLRPRAGVQDTNPENWVPHCYTSMEAMKPAYLEKVLTELFPHRFNAFQYATLKRALKGRPDAYHDSLLQLVQFLTGQDTVCSLVGDMRHHPTLILASPVEQTVATAGSIPSTSRWTGRAWAYTSSRSLPASASSRADCMTWARSTFQRHSCRHLACSPWRVMSSNWTRTSTTCLLPRDSKKPKLSNKSLNVRK
eukprot:5427512-Amphidinium_carterae.1